MQFFSASNRFHFFDEIHCGIDWQSLCPQNKKVLNLIPTQDKQLSAGVSPSAIVCLSLCGPVINCRHVEGVTPPSPFEGWERLQQPLSAGQTIENGWKDSFFHLLTSNVEFVTICGNIWFIFFHLGISVNDCSRFMGRPKANSHKQGTPARQPATRSSAVISRPRGSPCMFYSRLQQQ